MVTIAARGLADDGANAAHAHRPLVEDRRKVVLRGAGKHVATLNQRKSSLVTTSPRGLRLGSVERRLGVAAQALSEIEFAVSRTRSRIAPEAGMTIVTCKPPCP